VIVSREVLVSNAQRGTLEAVRGPRVRRPTRPNSATRSRLVCTDPDDDGMVLLCTMNESTRAHLSGTIWGSGDAGSRPCRLL